MSWSSNRSSSTTARCPHQRKHYQRRARHPSPGHQAATRLRTVRPRRYHGRCPTPSSRADCSPRRNLSQWSSRTRVHQSNSAPTTTPTWPASPLRPSPHPTERPTGARGTWTYRPPCRCHRWGLSGIAFRPPSGQPQHQGRACQRRSDPTHPQVCTEGPTQWAPAADRRTAQRQTTKHQARRGPAHRTATMAKSTRWCRGRTCLFDYRRRLPATSSRQKRRLAAIARWGPPTAAPMAGTGHQTTSFTNRTSCYQLHHSMTTRIQQQ